MKTNKSSDDYCTLFFEKINDYDISGCCKIHDEDYEEQLLSRKVCDKNLGICVNNVTHTKIGNLMCVGVRLFGWIFWYWHKYYYQIKAKHK